MLLCRQQESYLLKMSIYISCPLISVLYYWTSDSLNEGLPIKMTKEKFQRKLYFFSMKKIVGSTLELCAKAFFSLDKCQLNNMGFVSSFMPQT